MTGPLLAAMVAMTTAADAPAVLRWGADAQGGAPYVFQDPIDPTRLGGFEVELANELSKRLDRSPRPVFGPWERLLDLLDRGDFDVALNGIEVTEDKRSVVLLSRPYLKVPEVLTVRTGDTNAPRSLAGLINRKVGTLPGTMAWRLLERAGAEVKAYEGGQDDIYNDLALGRIDAVLLDAPAALYYAEGDARFERVAAELGTVEYAIALRLGDTALLAEVDAALLAMEQDGTFDVLYRRWGLLPNQNLDDATELHRWQSAGKPLPLFERIRVRYPRVLPMFLKGAGLTLGVSLCAMALAVMLGVLLAIGRRYGGSLLSTLCLIYIEVFRGTPLLVQLTLIYFGLPELGVKLPPFLAGVVALGLNYAAAEAENYRAGLESVPPGQLEASGVLGLTRWQTLRFVVAPQAVRVSIPPMTNDFIALLKDSSLVSIVTLTELTRAYTTAANSIHDHLGLGVVVAICYLIIGLPFARVARYAEARLGRHLRKAHP